MNKRNKNCKRLRRISLSVFFCLSVIFSINVYADWQNLVEQSRQFKYQYYLAKAKQLPSSNASIAALKREFDDLVSKKKEEQAIVSLIAHKKLIADNLDSDDVATFISFLFKHDLKLFIDSVSQDFFEYGDMFSVAKLHFEYGSYYFSVDDYDKALTHLTAIESQDALSRHEQDYATLMFGVILQAKKKHRDAMKIYQRIEPDSYYFSYAQLNKAVGQIRQGWWTDAHIAINEALDTQQPEEYREISNRLLLVMAYSQLQHEFYRNARDTFRRIRLDSRYVNRALLGLGLCAINQKDYIGAINALTRLQNVDNNSLEVMETYVLIPMAYERNRDKDTAAALFNEGLAYFENQKRFIEKDRIDNSLGNINRHTHPHLFSYLPTNVMSMYEFLVTVDTESLDTGIQQRKSNLIGQFNARFKPYFSEKIEQKNKFVSSYLSQTQYGLATLYDKKK